VPAPIASRPRTSPVESSGIRCLITLRLSCGRALELAPESLGASREPTV
jgi:hypothetical protein